MIQLPRLMDSALTEVARVRPVKLSYTLKWAPLSTATLTILKADATVTVGMFAELYDEQGSIGYYIATKVTDGYKGAPTSVITLEHAISTLSDDVVFGYHDYGGTGVNMATVLGQLIALQTTPRWQLGTCDYTTQYQYSFENDNLLTAFLSIAKPLADAYTWDFDFTTTPWTVNLLAAPESDASEIRLNRNAESVKIEIDRSNLCTRMYPLGYGEGVNQLTVASVNSGYRYIEDTAAQSAWGIVTSVYTDTTVTEAATLKAMAQALLDIRKTPQVTITVSALDIYTLTGEPFDAFYPGRICRVELPDYGVSVRERVVSITKSDVFGNPTKATLTLSNEVEDAIAVLSNLSRKSAISELYSQGATNQYAVHFADNADASNPAEMSFYVDENAVHINNVECKFKLEAFRGYSKGAAAGGGGTHTSASGGSQEVTSSSTLDHTGYAGEYEYTGEATGDTGASSASSTAGASVYETSAASGNTGSGGAVATGSSSLSTTGSSGAYTNTGAASGNTDDATASHYHTIGSHQHKQTSGTYTEATRPSCSASDNTNHNHGLGSHVHTIGAHDHSMSHTHTGGSHTHDLGGHTHTMGHTHDMSHTHSIGTHKHFIGSHRHSMSHTHTISINGHTHNVTIPTHTHDPVLGIYKGSTAASVVVKVDGSTVPVGAITDGTFNAVPYLNKDTNGRITRGTWHEIEITPDVNTRIVADLHVKTFVRSISGGNY